MAPLDRIKAPINDAAADLGATFGVNVAMNLLHASDHYTSDPEGTLAREANDDAMAYHQDFADAARRVADTGQDGILGRGADRVLRRVSDCAGAARGGWRVGDDIYAATAKGNTPAWSTIRSRYWKNEAAAPGAADRWGAANVEQMGTGRAPQRYNPDKGGLESMELSHEPIPRREGGTGLVPRWPQDHGAIDPYRRPGY